ncbi:MAG: complex I NDUFA9 subunit family protein [Gammaproteobacteria bacterium]
MYTIKDKRIVVFGGTGFIGRELISRLARAGAYVTLLARHPQRSQGLGVLSRVRIIRGDVRDAACVGQALAGQDAAINLIGVLDGAPRQMRALHVDWPKRLVESGRELEHIVHVSAANADADGPSRYLATKGEGEAAISQGAVPWTIVAPSVVFGIDDTLFNRFALLLRLSPGVMPVVRPQARFSPVHVGDVAEAIVRALVRDDTVGRRLPLGGPEIWTMREMLDYTRRQIGSRRLLIDLPDPLARMQAMVMGLLPGRPFSTDQLHTLGVDAVADAAELRKLGIEPAAVEAVVPFYLGRDRRQIQFDRFRQEAGGAPTDR